MPGCGPGGLLAPDDRPPRRRRPDGSRPTPWTANPAHAAQAAAAAQGRATVRKGDVFAPAAAIRLDTGGLDPAAGIDLLLAAHVGYYAPDLGRWDARMQRLIAARGVAVIIQEAAFAPFSARLNPVSGTRVTARLRRSWRRADGPMRWSASAPASGCRRLTAALIESLAAAPPLEEGNPHGDLPEGPGGAPPGRIPDPSAPWEDGHSRRPPPLPGRAARPSPAANGGLVPIDNALIIVLPAPRRRSGTERRRRALERRIRDRLS